MPKYLQSIEIRASILKIDFIWTQEKLKNNTLSNIVIISLVLGSHTYKLNEPSLYDYTTAHILT